MRPLLHSRLCPEASLHRRWLLALRHLYPDMWHRHSLYIRGQHVYGGGSAVRTAVGATPPGFSGRCLRLSENGCGHSYSMLVLDRISEVQLSIPI